MITGKKKISIVNIGIRKDSETGDRIKFVESGKTLVANVELVGIQTQQVAQAQNVNLSYQIEISRMQFKNEKYVYFETNLYEIMSISKAKLNTNMNLNVQKIVDAEISNAIESWLVL